jgi:hypothetical protein
MKTNKIKVEKAFVFIQSSFSVKLNDYRISSNIFRKSDAPGSFKPGIYYLACNIPINIKIQI